MIFGRDTAPVHSRGVFISGNQSLTFGSIFLWQVSPVSAPVRRSLTVRRYILQHIGPLPSDAPVPPAAPVDQAVGVFSLTPLHSAEALSP